MKEILSMCTITNYEFAEILLRMLKKIFCKYHEKKLHNVIEKNQPRK